MRILSLLLTFLFVSPALAQTPIQGTGADGAAVAGAPMRISGKDGAGNSQDIVTDASGELQIDILTGGGGTEFAEDSGHTSGQNGKMCLVVRQDADASLVGTDLDYAPIQVDATGRVKVNVVAALPTGANTIGALTANQSVNVAQMNGVATTMGNGVAGTGVQRVAIASDNTAFSVNATLAAGTANAGNVDVERFATAGTAGTESTAQTADFNLATALANQRILGFTAREDAVTAAAATFVVRHGVLAAGVCDDTNVFAYAELSSNQSITVDFGDRGLNAADGICVDVLSGRISANAHTVTEASP